MSFDWQTEEDGGWEDETWQVKPETAVVNKPPWRTLLLIFVLVAVVGVVLYQQVNRRLVDATSAVEADIFASHNLISRAVAELDANLGKAVLSGRDMGWSQTQSDLMEAGLFYEHTGLGLALPDAEAAFAPLFREDERFIDLTLSPDLNGAELTYGRDFLAFTGEEIETVTLQQTAVYRRGETRWLLAPPLDAFWGEWQTVEVDNIEFAYPQRDEEVILQLTDDLQALLEEACHELPELDCSADTAVQIRFDTDPESLLEAADLTTLYDANLRLDLPTPTLIGTPINNEGYDALLYAYGVKLISAFVGDQIGYDCCDHAPMFQAIMTYQLSELGLATWPVTQEVQQPLATSGVHTEMLFPYWNSTDFSLIHDENSEQLFGFIDFLLNQHVTSESPIWLMNEMATSRAYQSWLVGLAGDTSGSVELISRDWWFYTITQSEMLNASAQPISLPAQDLQIGCLGMDSLTSANVGQTTLFRYQVADESWIEEFDYPGIAFFNPLPQDNGVILQLIELSEEQYWQTLLWRNGSSVEIMNMSNVYSISLGQMDPNGRFLLSYFGGVEDEFLPQPLLIDVDSCLSGNCNSTTPGQTPYWSPDGQTMLLSETHLFESTQYMVDGRMITLGTEGVTDSSQLSLRSTQAEPEEAVSIGNGAAPFWISNEIFGFIRTMPDANRQVYQEVVIASVDDVTPTPVVETAALQAALVDENFRNPLLMHYGIAHPTNEALLLVLASSQGQDGYLFQVNWQNQEVDLLFPVDLSRGEHSLGFSPDGRFLVATGAMQRRAELSRLDVPFGALHLYDLETGNLQTILTNVETFFPAFTFDWSLDGNWLAFTRNTNVIGLIAPAHDYQQMIVHENEECTSLAWINPLPTLPE